MRKVILTAKAFLNGIKFLSQFARHDMPRGQWVEAMGFLFCKTHGNNYIIADAVGMTSGNDVYVQMDNYQLAKVVELEEARPGTFLGGWFHSHPGLSIFYSDTDVRNQMFYQQQNPDGLGFVFDLTTVSSTFLGLKVFRLHSANATTYYEVEYELSGFTEETLLEAFEPIGVPRKTIHELAVHLGIAGGEGFEELAALEVPETDDPLATGREYLAKVQPLYAEGQFSRALEYCRIADALLERAGDAPARAECLVTLVELLVRTRNNQTATEKVAVLRALEGVPHPKYWAGTGAVLLGKMHLLSRRLADLDAAVAAFEDALQAFRAEAYAPGEAEALSYKGSALWKLGKHAAAHEAWRAALEVVTRVEEEGCAHEMAPHDTTIWALRRLGLENQINRGVSQPASVEFVE